MSSRDSFFLELDLVRKPEPAFRDHALAPLGQGDDVVQLFGAGFKEAADVACSLPDALLVLHQRDAHVAFAALAEAGAGRDRDLGLLDQEGRKIDAAKACERLGDRRPGEHGRARRRYLPAGTAEGLHQYIAAALVDRTHLMDAIIGPVERRGRRHLNRREGAVVEIGLHAPEGGDDALVADREAHAPARHRIGLRHRGELDCEIHRARHLQHRRWRIAVEIDFGIGKIG